MDGSSIAACGCQGDYSWVVPPITYYLTVPLILNKTLRIFNDFSRKTHGHGGHEHGACRGFLGVSFHVRRCPQGIASVLSKKPPFLGPDDQSYTTWRYIGIQVLEFPNQHFSCDLRGNKCRLEEAICKKLKGGKIAHLEHQNAFWSMICVWRSGDTAYRRAWPQCSKRRLDSEVTLNIKLSNSYLKDIFDFPLLTSKCLRVNDLQSINTDKNRTKLASLNCW